MSRSLLLLGVLFLAACTFSPSYDVTCTEEGARLDGKVCSQGVWVWTGSNGGGGEDTGVPDACVPETDQQLCLRAGFNCGTGPLTDNCGAMRSVTCGPCAQGSECPTESFNTCDCTAGTPDYECAALECGDVPTMDNCGNPTTFPCGETCGTNESCSDNTCVCDEAAACAQLAVGAACGELTLPDAMRCGSQTTVQCGCGNDAMCEAGACVCDEGLKLQGRACVPEDACPVACDTLERCAELPDEPDTYACRCIDGYERATSGVCEPIPPPPVLVTDVRSIVIADFDGTTKEHLFATPIAAANSVPFISARMSGTGDVMGANTFEVSLSDDKAVLRRTNNTGSIDAALSVVQFDPAHVRVQQGAYFIDDRSVTVDLDDTVDPDHAFIVFYARFESGQERKDRHRAFVRAAFNNNGEGVTFTRRTTGSRVHGTYWVVDSTHFTVEHLSAEFLEDTDDEVEIDVTAPNPAESFVLFSSSTTYSGEEANHANVTCALDVDEVACTRSARNGTVTVNAQVVSTDLIAVQHHAVLLGGNMQNQDVTIVPVGERSTVTSGVSGVAGSQHVNFVGTPPGFVMMTLNNLRTEVALTRGSDTAGASVSTAWQVIDWAP